MTNEAESRLFYQLQQNRDFESWLVHQLNTVAMALTDATDMDRVRNLQGQAQLLKIMARKLQDARVRATTQKTTHKRV